MEFRKDVDFEMHGVSIAIYRHHITLRAGIKTEAEFCSKNFNNFLTLSHFLRVRYF